MGNLYASLYWSRHYREEALREARKRQLVNKIRAGHEPRGIRRLGSA